LPRGLEKFPKNYYFKIFMRFFKKKGIRTFKLKKKWLIYYIENKNILMDNYIV